MNLEIVHTDVNTVFQDLTAEGKTKNKKQTNKQTNKKIVRIQSSSLI